MTNRREVIQAGIAVSAISVTGTAAQSAAMTSSLQRDGLVRLDGLVFDQRFAQAAEVAHSAARYGTPLYPIGGDTADIWYHHLRKLWQGPHAAFAGITSMEALFVFETLAGDHRLRLVYRGVHEHPEAGAVAHTLSGPASTIDTAGLDSSRGQWMHRVGYVMTHCASSGAVKTINVATEAEQSSGRRYPLVSWIVAPASWSMAAVGLRTLMGCGGMYGQVQS